MCSRPQGPQGPQGVGAEGGSDGGGAAARASVQCPVCGRQFQGTKRNYLLNRHFQIHTGEKPYQCPHCSHRANRKSNLKMHIESRHGAQAAFYALTPEPGATPDAALPPFLPDALGAGGPEDVQKGGPAARAGELGPGPKGTKGGPLADPGAANASHLKLNYGPQEAQLGPGASFGTFQDTGTLRQDLADARPHRGAIQANYSQQQ